MVMQKVILVLALFLVSCLAGMMQIDHIWDFFDVAFILCWALMALVVCVVKE
jgi:hypothetical protein